MTLHEKLRYERRTQQKNVRLKIFSWFTQSPNEFRWIYKNKEGHSRFQNSHDQKLSTVKVVKYAKWANICHDKIIKERGLGCCLLL